MSETLLYKLDLKSELKNKVEVATMNSIISNLTRRIEWKKAIY